MPLPSLGPISYFISSTVTYVWRTYLFTFVPYCCYLRTASELAFLYFLFTYLINPFIIRRPPPTPPCPSFIHFLPSIAENPLLSFPSTALFNWTKEVRQGGFQTFPLNHGILDFHYFLLSSPASPHTCDTNSHTLITNLPFPVQNLAPQLLF